MIKSGQNLMYGYVAGLGRYEVRVSIAERSVSERHSLLLMEVESLLVASATFFFHIPRRLSAGYSQ